MHSQPQVLNYAIKQELMYNFPNIKLCYDNITHNKVDKSILNISYDICCAIPCGKKCFVWFTCLKDKNVCLILELIDKKNIGNIKIYNCVFNNELLYGKFGTIFYGTLFHISQTPFFTVEDIFYFKGNDVSNNNWLNKFDILTNIFSNYIKQISYNKTFIVLGLPLMARDTIELKRITENIQYKIYNIQFRSFNKSNTMDTIQINDINSIVKKSEAIQQSLINECSHLSTINNISKQTIVPKYPSKSKLETKDIIFKVKADIQNDIYNLYCIENKEEIFYNVAYVPDYKTSVMMNKLFRNIKENENLDLLEESDDEEEFENENIDRFVDINKSMLMICKFNHKFKKWYPIKEYTGKTQIVTDKNELQDYEKFNYNQYKNNTNSNYNHHNKNQNKQNKYNKQLHNHKTNYRN